MVAQSLFYALAIGFFVLVSNSNAAEGESHTVMYFKRSGNQIHVVPRNMMGSVKLICLTDDVSESKT